MSGLVIHLAVVAVGPLGLNFLGGLSSLRPMIVSRPDYQPPLGRRFLANIREVIPEGQDSRGAELEAARDFVANAPTDGQVPARTPYAFTRDEAFIKSWYVGASISRIMKNKPSSCNLEDAREAIYVGRRAGYSDSDIAAYLIRNYLL